MQITLSPKQELLLKKMCDNKYTEVGCGGSAGGAKSWAICAIAVIKAWQYPGYKCAIGRKTSSMLNKTTKETMYKVLNEYKMIEGTDYQWKNAIGELWFMNGSKVLFLALDPHQDPEFAKLGSLEIDDIYLDEAGEVVELVYSTSKSRIGRGVATKLYHMSGKILMSMNPSQNFVKKKCYEPYAKLGGGDYQEWENGSTYDENNNKITAYACFIRMSVYDNPFVPASYIENLKSLSGIQRKRLYEGDWNYADDEKSLVSGEMFDNAIVYQMPEIEKRIEDYNPQGIISTRRMTREIEVFDKCIGIDVADTGGDFTVVTLIDRGVVYDQVELKVQTNHKDAPMGLLLAEECIKLFNRWGFTKDRSRSIWVEVNGVGTTLRDNLRLKGWLITAATATAKSRQEMLWGLREDLESGKLKIWHKLKTIDTLRDMLQAHEVNYDGPDPVVEGKGNIKAKIGRSPDNSDSLAWANMARRRGQKGVAGRHMTAISL